MTEKKLNVFLSGEHVADLTQDNNGKISLAYLPKLNGAMDLSFSLPYSEGPVSSKVVRAFIEGLVPESEDARRAIARLHDVSSYRNPFAILEVIGRECAGAVQFIPEGQTIDNEGGLRLCDESEIAERLTALNENQQQSWIMPEEHWSLGGAQSKFALREQGENWYEAQGAEPTTHIFKPGIHSLKDQALNEHLCLRTLHHAGMRVAETRYLTFAGVPAIVSTRYDRFADPLSGQIIRIHQEDLCQAAGLTPDKKYMVTAEKVIGILRQVEVPEEDIDSFVGAYVANYLLGAPDGHAKNYSLLYFPGMPPRLAPLYDIASSLVYEGLNGRRPGIPGKPTELKKTAMAIGGEREFERVTSRHWTRAAQQLGYDEEKLRNIVSILADILPRALTHAIEEDSEAVGESELPAKLTQGVERLCQTTLTMLDKDYPGGRRV